MSLMGIGMVYSGKAETKISKIQGMSSEEKLAITRSLEKEGKVLFRSGKYDQALEVFHKANDPKYWLYEGRPNGFAESYIREIHVMREEYDKALERIEKLLPLVAGNQHFMDQKEEYEALIQYKNTKDPKYVYDYIKTLGARYSNKLPPIGYKLTSVIQIGTILRLYDTIGDQDAGIAFIDEVLVYFRTGKAGDPKPGPVDAEYMKVREAFEKDKAEGTKGRATKVLIQSDYFPW